MKFALWTSNSSRARLQCKFSANVRICATMHPVSHLIGKGKSRRNGFSVKGFLEKSRFKDRIINSVFFVLLSEDLFFFFTRHSKVLSVKRSVARVCDFSISRDESKFQNCVLYLSLREIDFDSKRLIVSKRRDKHVNGWISLMRLIAKNAPFRSFMQASLYGRPWFFSHDGILWWRSPVALWRFNFHNAD